MTSATLVLPSDRVISRRERWIVLSAGVAVTLVAWYLLGAASPHSAGWSAALLHAHHHAADGRTVFAAVFMWQTMMVAMMAPIVLRWIVVFGALLAEAVPGRRVTPTLAAFATGYFAIWSIYSVACGTLQAFLHQAALIDLQDGMRATAAGVVLAGAGLFQQSAFKRACLAHCRSPLGYFLTRWRNGPMGGFRLGVGHGLVLRRMLLGHDGGCTCGRCDEPPVDGALDDRDVRRTNRASRRSDRARPRLGHDRLGHRADRQRMTTVNRRTCLQAFAAALASRVLQANAPGPLGLQLFTVRDLLQQDPERTLRAIGAIGYTEVEMFGFGGNVFIKDPLFGRSASQMRQLLDDCRLRVPSTQIADRADSIPAIAATVLELGVEYLVIGMPSDFLTVTPTGPVISGVQGRDQIRRLAERLNAMGTMCHAHGLRFGYHNHHMEFAAIDGRRPLIYCSS